jgi:hypothetical protein
MQDFFTSKGTTKCWYGDGISAAFATPMDNPYVIGGPPLLTVVSPRGAAPKSTRADFMRIPHPLKRESAMQANVSFLTRLVLACALAGTVIFTSASAQSPPQPSFHFRLQLVGSWLVTYDVQAFGVPIPILLSFGRDGLMIESDSPAPTPVGNLGVPIATTDMARGWPRGRASLRTSIGS